MSSGTQVNGLYTEDGTRGIIKEFSEIRKKTFDRHAAIMRSIGDRVDSRVMEMQMRAVEMVCWARRHDLEFSGEDAPDEDPSVWVPADANDLRDDTLIALVNARIWPMGMFVERAIVDRDAYVAPASDAPNVWKLTLHSPL